MRYQDVVEKMPNATYFYEGVTQKELDKITVSKYELEDDSNPELYVVGSMFEIDSIKDKKMIPTFGMKFG